MLTMSIPGWWDFSLWLLYLQILQICIFKIEYTQFCNHIIHLKISFVFCYFNIMLGRKNGRVLIAWIFVVN